jgi:DNA-binding XRE family transcriptional regulator
MRCAECGKGRLKRGIVEIQTRVGPWVVAEPNARAFLCGECGSFEIEAKELGRVEIRAAFTVLMDHEEFDGAMLRDARRMLGMTQRELAHKLGRRHETVCRDEKAESLDHELRYAMIGLLATRMRADGIPLAGAR